MWASIASVGFLTGHRAGLKALLLAAATGAAPIVAVAHLAKASAKLTSWAGYLPLALRDPHGVDTMQRLANHSLVTPASLVALPVIGWVTIALLGLLAWRALRWVREMPAESAAAARAGMAGTAVLFTAVLTVWTWTAR